VKVVCYARNYKLDFTIPYRFAEAKHMYVPDFIVVLAQDSHDSAAPRLNSAAPRLNLVLEIKGEEDERDRAKAAGAWRWVEAVNYAATYGRWHYEVCKDVDSLRTRLDVVVHSLVG
jgi:type III restriction enzyme